MNIGNFIREHRIRHGMTQIDLGKLLNVTNTTISNYENGVSLPDLNTFLNMSDIFHTNYMPFIALFQDLTDNCELYEKAFSELYHCIKNIPRFRLAAISANPAWKYRGFNSDKCFIIVENEPNLLKNNSLVIAPVPEGEEHIYKIRYCGENTYLMPESGPTYLTPVKIEKDTVSLKRIIAIIQYP